MTRALLALVLAAAALAACAPRPKTPPPATAASGGAAAPAAAAAAPAAPPAPGVVDARTGLGIAASGARVVDVRTPEEFADGHLPGALNIPFDQIGSRAAEIGPPETPVLLYCRSGRRSGAATETLRGLGYGKVWDAQRYDALAAEAAQAR